MNSYYQTGLRNLLDRSVLSPPISTWTAAAQGGRDSLRLSAQAHVRRRRYEGDHVYLQGCRRGHLQGLHALPGDDEIHLMIDLIKNDLLEEYEALSRDGYRVLGIAYREFPQSQTTFSVADESELILLGYIAFLDPPKSSAARPSPRSRITVSRQKSSPATTRSSPARFARTSISRRRDRHRRPSFSASTRTSSASWPKNERLRAPLALAKGEHPHGPAKTRARHRLHGRWHQRRALDARGRRRHFRGHRRRCREGIRRHHLLEKSLLVLEDGILEGRRVFGNIIKYIRMGASSNFGTCSVSSARAISCPSCRWLRSRCSSTTCSTTPRRSAFPRPRR